MYTFVSRPFPIRDSKGDTYRLIYYVAWERGRYKCELCYRQFNRVEYLVEHVKNSHHSEHEPKCSLCGKHVKTFDALRDHLIGPLPKVECALTFSKMGCSLCFHVFATPEELAAHIPSCRMSPPVSPVPFAVRANKRIQSDKDKFHESLNIQAPFHSTQKQNTATSASASTSTSTSTSNSAVSIACLMFFIGQDPLLDLCMVDENERLLVRASVKPYFLYQISNYRYGSPARRSGYATNAMLQRQAKEMLEGILQRGQGVNRRGRIIVGYDFEHFLPRLGLDVPKERRRDIARYPPLLKTNKASNTLKDLTKLLLGYDIEKNGKPDAFDEAVAAMRIYRRIKSNVHPTTTKNEYERGRILSLINNNQLEKMSAAGVLSLSVSDYYCWCLDSFW